MLFPNPSAMSLFRKLTQFLRASGAAKPASVLDGSFGEFMNCKSLPEALKVVYAHPGLLGDKTLNLLGQLRAESDAKIKDPLPAEYFRQRMHWIQGFRAAEVLKWPNDRSSVSLPDSFSQLIATQATTETWDGLRLVLDANPVLMSVVGMSMLGFVMHSVNDAGDCPTAFRFAHRLWVVKNCKKQGVNEGIALCEKVEGPDKPDPFKVLESFLLTPSDAEAERILKDASYLISAPALTVMKRITRFAETTVPDYKSAVNKRIALVEYLMTK